MPLLLDQLRESLAPEYEVERELGTGGMGSVFLARDPKLDRHVAIKVLRPDQLSEVAPERFQREARVLARLRHPNIVSIYQAGEAGGLSYYVMEYVEGETLAKRLKRGAMGKAEVLKLGDDLLSALAAAHETGIVHRDVKPTNIFLVDDRAVLADFGIAKRTGETGEPLTATDRRVGTPGYMAPEQFMGDVVTPATDIYTVGMCLYEALTGRRWSIFTQTDEADWTEVPTDLVPVLRRSLEWLPIERWADASEFRGALAGTRDSAIVRKKARTPPEAIYVRTAIPRWMGTISYPFRRAAWAGFTYAIVGWLLVELARQLADANFIPAVVGAASTPVYLAGFLATVIITYLRARRSEHSRE